LENISWAKEERRLESVFLIACPFGSESLTQTLRITSRCSAPPGLTAPTVEADDSLQETT
jgi:hypothetical protein